ncbi:MAG: hypothetical protein Q9201_006240 [Fulgogasparrea decipioides]
MSVELADLDTTHQNHRSKHERDRRKPKKRKRADQEDIEAPLPRKKHRSEKHPHRSQIQVTTPRTSVTQRPTESSPFHQQTSSLYLPLPPIALNYPLQGLCAEHLSPLILTYYPPLRGVIVSYHNPRLSTTSQQNQVAGDGSVLAKTIDEYAAPHIWVTAEFLVFRPQKGNMIEGWVNLQNEGNIGLVCWNFFNASIERKRLPQGWKWNPGNLAAKGLRRKLKGSERSNLSELNAMDADVQISGVSDVRGYFVDEDGSKVGGLVRFMVKDVETSRGSGGDSGFLSIEGSLLDEAGEQDLRQSEIRQASSRERKHQTKDHGEVYLMSGALVSEDDENAEAKIPKKSRHRKSY